MVFLKNTRSTESGEMVLRHGSVSSIFPNLEYRHSEMGHRRKRISQGESEMWEEVGVAPIPKSVVKNWSEFCTISQCSNTKINPFYFAETFRNLALYIRPLRKISGFGMGQSACPITLGEK